MRHGYKASIVVGLAGLATVSLAVAPSPKVLQEAIGSGGSAYAATLESLQDRERYMREVAAFSSRALDSGTPEALATRERILSEWSVVETAWHVLTLSQGTPWDEAQVSFQQASDSFILTWHEQVADDL